LHGGNDDAAVDRLLARDRVSDLQQFEPVGAHGHRSFSFVLGAIPLIDGGGLDMVGPGFGLSTPCGSVLYVLPVLPPRGTFRRLPALERLGDQGVGEDEFGLRHFFDWQQNLVWLAGHGIIVANTRRRALYTQQHAAKPPPAIDGDRHFNLQAVPGETLKIRAPHSGRSNPGEDSSSRYARSIGSATSSTGESARETLSQSSTVMVPSGRSAIIWTVQPSAPETRTRTSR